MFPSNVSSAAVAQIMVVDDTTYEGSHDFTVAAALGNDVVASQTFYIVDSEGKTFKSEGSGERGFGED